MRFLTPFGMTVYIVNVGKGGGEAALLFPYSFRATRHFEQSEKT